VKDPEFRVGLNFVITIENHNEILVAAHQARNSRAHYIRFEPEFYTALGHETTAEVVLQIRDSLAEAEGAVPISEAEYKYFKKYGDRRLEDLLEIKEVDFFDVERASAV
jgi:hypothetical protein